ncbi:acyl-CoA dehydrogenase family protein [Nocardia sp. NPDC050378]|uniref:acyl-CoA dehydrogenase family protein n=1 Tax=Nocardia sp. NPDC050378 TaxID=3155400 RepID=UPI0033F17E1F
MTDVDLLYTEVEDDLRAVVRSVLTAQCEPGAVTALYDGDRALVAGLWKNIAVDLGLAGLLVPEADGGAGASAREAAVVLEELGRFVAPVPFLTSAVVATTALLGSGSALLGQLAAGERTAALAVPLTTAAHAVSPTVSADADGRLTGDVTSVAGALESDVLLVPATGPEGVALYAISTADANLTPVVSFDMTRQLADLGFDGAAGELVVADGAAAVGRALAAGTALLASEQYGLARWCLDETVAYLRERRQFGRVVGGFQAIKHRLAELYTAVESGNAAARYAAATLATDDADAPVAASVAQAFCSDLAVHAGEEAVQLHGGMGMTWEHPAHLYLKRAKADQLAFGTAGTHRLRLAELVEVPRP